MVFDHIYCITVLLGDNETPYTYHSKSHMPCFKESFPLRTAVTVVQPLLPTQPHHSKRSHRQNCGLHAILHLLGSVELCTFYMLVYCYPKAIDQTNMGLLSIATSPVENITKQWQTILGN